MANMNDIKIKNESLAERCEICHQNDLFDQSTGICKRCFDFTSDYINQEDDINIHYQIPILYDPMVVKPFNCLLNESIKTIGEQKFNFIDKTNLINLENNFKSNEIEQSDITNKFLLFAII